jgi:hypothetical protein
MNRVKNEKKILTTAIQEKKKSLKFVFHTNIHSRYAGKDWDSLFLFDSFLRP